MNQEPQNDKPTVDDDDDDDLIEGDLPPLAEDEEDKELGLPLDSLLEEQRDDGMSWLDDRVGIDDYNAEEVADDLGTIEGGEEESWTTDSEGDETLEGTEADIGSGDEYGWTKDNEAIGANGDWDDDLDLQESEGHSILDDAGEEGLDEDQLEIDTTRWGSLGGEIVGDGVEGDDEAAGLDLGLSFEEEVRISGGALPLPLDEKMLKAAWLGPPTAQPTALAFRDGSLYAAGAGLYHPSGRQLVATGASPQVEQRQATSVAIDPDSPETLYIGTTTGGLLVSRDGGDTVEPKNSWTSAAPGCGSPNSPAVSVVVHSSSSGLWLRTAHDKLLRSTDQGQTWSTALADVAVRLVACDPAGPAVAALTRDDQGVAVRWSRDGQHFERRALSDDQAEVLWSSPEARLGVRDETVLLGAEELTDGVLHSSSAEEPWGVLDQCPRATALAALGPSQRPALLAGLFFAGKDLGALVRRDPETDQWVMVCEIGRLQGLFDIEQIGIHEVSARIIAVAADPDNPRQIALATGVGVFLIEMKDLSFDEPR